MITFNKSLKWTIITSVIFLFILINGDLYTLQYAFILLFTSFIYRLFHNRNGLLQIPFVVVLFLLFASFKILPLLEVRSFLTKEIEPFSGSQNIISAIYYLFIPIKPLFQLFNLKQFITTDFAWWEKIAFIGPLPLLIFLILIIKYKKINFKYKNFLIILLFILFLVSMPAFWFNPYNILIKNISILQTFHVPSRVFSLLIVIFLLIEGFILNIFLNKFKSYKRIIYFVLIVNTFFTIIFFEVVLIKKSLPDLNLNYSKLLSRLKENDKSIYYISYQLSKSQIPRYIATENHQKLIQNYPFLLKNSPAEHYIKYDFNPNHKYVDIIPKYSLTQKNISPPKIGELKVYLTEKDVVAYKLEDYTPYALIQNKESSDLAQLSPDEGYVDSSTIDINQITIKAVSSKENLKLTLIESYYPGWEIFVDNKKGQLIPGRFLSTQLEKGSHAYVFKFSSSPFKIGLIISAVSLAIFAFIFLRSINKNRNF